MSLSKSLGHEFSVKVFGNFLNLAIDDTEDVAISIVVIAAGFEARIATPLSHYIISFGDEVIGGDGDTPFNVLTQTAATC